jgi:hypothetical protein
MTEKLYESCKFLKCRQLVGEETPAYTELYCSGKLPVDRILKKINTFSNLLCQKKNFSIIRSFMVRSLSLSAIKIW